MRIIARDSISGQKAFLIRLLGVVCALLTGMAFLAVAGHNPLSVMISLLDGAFGNARRIAKTVEFAIPLVITSLGISLAFRMKFWNIGAEGQICMGAFAASYFALFCTELACLAAFCRYGWLVACCGGDLGGNTRAVQGKVGHK